MALLKGITTCVGEDVEKPEPSHTARENLQRCSYFKNRLVGLQKLNIELSYDLIIQVLGT